MKVFLSLFMQMIDNKCFTEILMQKSSYIISKIKYVSASSKLTEQL